MVQRKNQYQFFERGSVPQKVIDFCRTSTIPLYHAKSNRSYFIDRGADLAWVFFESQHNNHIEYSKQAFSKGRQRIKPEAFQELLLAVAERFYQTAETNKWRGYHLFGIDGTRLNLPCTQELEEIYGSQTSQGAPQVQALVSCLYDLLNGMIVDTRFRSCKSSERDAAKDMIESSK